MKNWILPIAMGLISLGVIVFTGHISITFVLERYGGDPLWVVLSVVAIAIEVLGTIGITELWKRKHKISALLGIPFLGLAIITTVSFEFGNFAQATSDTVASRQYDADAFKENRQSLSSLREKRDDALAKGWTKSARKYQTSIDDLKKWAAGTKNVSEVDPRATIIARYTGINPSRINDALVTLIILFLLAGRTITPYWTYQLCPRTDRSRSEPPNRSPEQFGEHLKKGSGNGLKSENEPQLKLVHDSENSHVLENDIEVVRMFLNKNTVPSKGSVIGATELFRAFQTHYPDISQCRFGRMLKELGYTEKKRCKSTGRLQYVNIAWRYTASASMAA